MEKDLSVELAARREWTPDDIVEETERQHTGDLGFFSVLYNVSDAAFGGHLTEPDLQNWEWPSENDPDDDDFDPDGNPSNWYEFSVDGITVGKLVDFFNKHERGVPLKWHNQVGGPAAYVVVDDRDIAADFRRCFGIGWLTKGECKDLCEEDRLRASR